MSQEKSARLRPADRVVLLVLLGLAVATGLLYLLSILGLRLVSGALYILLPVLLLLTALGWGLSAIVRRFKKPVIRKVAVAVAAFIMVALTMLAAQYGSFVAGLTLPARYAVMTSPGGNRLIVMRALDADADRIEARHAARLAADPEGTQDYTAADWGYTYTAYGLGPMGLFYRPDTLIEGAVHIGYASAGELMLEWEDGDTVGRFYIKNPDPNDGGEMRARVK